MKRLLKLSILFLVLTYAGLSFEATTAGYSAPGVPDLSGSWVAYIPEDPEADYANMALDLSEWKNRGFFGNVGTSFAPTEPCHPTDPCRVTISNTGRLSLQAHVKGRMLTGQGQYLADEFGETMFVHFQVQYQNGSKDIGTVMLVRAE